MGSSRGGQVRARGTLACAVAIALVLLTAFVLSGCKITLGLTTQVNQSGSGTFGFRLAADKALLDLVGQQGSSAADLFGQVEKVFPQDWKTQQGTDADGTKWITVTVSFTDPADLQAKLTKAGGSFNLGLNSLELTQTKSFFSTTTNYAFTMNMASALGSLGSSLPAQITPSLISSVLVFENRVTLPGSIKSNNADKVEGNTLIWTPKIGGTTQMHATSQSLNWGMIILFIVLGVVVILLIVLLIILLARRGRAKNEPTPPEGSEQVGSGVPGAAEGAPQASAAAGAAEAAVVAEAGVAATTAELSAPAAAAEVVEPTAMAEAAEPTAVAEVVEPTEPMPVVPPAAMVEAPPATTVEAPAMPVDVLPPAMPAAEPVPAPVEPPAAPAPVPEQPAAPAEAAPPPPEEGAQS